MVSATIWLVSSLIWAALAGWDCADDRLWQASLKAIVSALSAITAAMLFAGV